MSEKNIVICDQEVKYAEKLMENIMELGIKKMEKRIIVIR